MKLHRRRFLTGLLATLSSRRGQGSETGRNSSVLGGLRFRVAADGWGEAGHPEVEAVVKSAAEILWKYFQKLKVEPFVVVRGREGPIVHYQRNVVGEIVMKLDTQDYLWCQYVYQFSHEFCHILCGFKNEPWRRTNWFEETICEAASLFVLRRMPDLWRKDPPFPNWRDYAPEFRRYASTVMDSRSQIGDGQLGSFFRTHQQVLEASPRDRSMNGAMALPLLALMEGTPESWEAIAWLNNSPSPEGESFADYLEKWRSAVPARHRAFVCEIMRRFEIPIVQHGVTGATGPTGPPDSHD